MFLIELYLFGMLIFFIGFWNSKQSKEITKSQTERFMFCLFFSFFWWISVGIMISIFLDEN